MRNTLRPRKLRTRGLATLAAAILVGLSIVSITLLIVDSSPGPEDVFQSHLAALDAGDWPSASIYLKDGCAVDFSIDYDDPQVALDELLASGFSFQSLRVDEVWINTNGKEALLGLVGRSGLPQIIELEKIDGDWLIGC